MDELRRIRARIVTPAKNNVPKADDAETQAASDRPDNAPPAKGAAPESETPDGTDEGMRYDESLPYEVGYGRPPKAYQYKSGVSGNPIRSAVADLTAPIANVA